MGVDTVSQWSVSHPQLSARDAGFLHFAGGAPNWAECRRVSDDAE
jgi:hypothetical protein